MNKWLVIVPVLVGVEGETEQDAKDAADALIINRKLYPYTGGGEHEANAMEADDDTPLDKTLHVVWVQ